MAHTYYILSPTCVEPFILRDEYLFGDAGPLVRKHVRIIEELSMKRHEDEVMSRAISHVL